MSERAHLVICALWCASAGGILALAPAGASLSRWIFWGMLASGLGGLLKAVHGAFAPPVR